MTTRRILIGSGYFNPNPGVVDTFVAIRNENIEDRYTDDYSRNVVISVGKSWRRELDWPGVEVIDLHGNCGHVHQLIGKQTPAKAHAYCGWSAAVMALALLAYCDESDLLYIEQDCLCFGDVIGELYRQMGDRKMVFGSYIEKGRHVMQCEQSLFLIRHDFIPEFVRSYLRYDDDTEIRMLPENKFAAMERHSNGLIGRHTIGPGRARPLPYDAPIWSAQKITSAEMQELKKRGLV